MPRDAPSEVDVVALAYFLAPSLRGGQVIADPAGQLRHLEAHISPRFEQPDAVGERIEDGLTRVTRRLSSLDPQAPWHEQVIAWSSPVSLPTQVPLLALLQTPTVRRRYVAARAVPAQHGDERLYRSLLKLLAAPTSARRSCSSTRTTWPSRSTSGRGGQHYLSVLRRPRPAGARYRPHRQLEARRRVPPVLAA